MDGDKRNFKKSPQELKLRRTTRKSTSPYQKLSHQQQHTGEAAAATAVAVEDNRKYGQGEDGYAIKIPNEGMSQLVKLAVQNLKVSDSPVAADSSPSSSKNRTDDGDEMMAMDVGQAVNVGEKSGQAKLGMQQQGTAAAVGSLNSNLKDVAVSPLAKLANCVSRRLNEFPPPVDRYQARFGDPRKLTSVMDSDDEDGAEIPIFTEKFLTYNKKQERKLAQLTKTHRELNRSNQLMKASQADETAALELLKQKKAEVVAAKEFLNSKYRPYQQFFQHIKLPTNPELDVMTDPEAYIKALGRILNGNDPNMMSFLMLAHGLLKAMCDTRDQ